MFYRKYHCPENLNNLEKLLKFYTAKLPELGKTDVIEMHGDAISTVGDEKNYLMMGLNSLAPNLLKWINECKNQYVNEYFTHKKCELKLRRFWVNSMNTNSEVKVHTHNPECVVMVFYLNAVPTSGNLVLLDTDAKELKLLDEFPKDKKLILPVTTGDLVIHQGSTPHGVTKWEESFPRVSFIIQYRIYWN